MVIPDGLYDVARLERAINIRMNAISDPRVHANFYRRPGGNDGSAVALPPCIPGTFLVRAISGRLWATRLVTVLIDADFPQRKHFLSLIIGKVTMYKVVQELYNIRTIYVQYTYKIVQLAAL